MDYYCNFCKKEISEKVYEYSLENYGRVLCRECQNNPDLNKTDNYLAKQDGLSEGKSRFTEGMIKGRIAEALIEELFLNLGYNVFRYGMENTVPGIMKLLKGVRGDVATNIRRMPDFVVQKDKKVFFIEVKFRSSESFAFHDIPKEYPFENTYFVIISKKHIKCISYEELKRGEEISPDSRKYYLGDREEFELDKKVIIDFCNFAVKFFEGV